MFVRSHGFAAFAASLLVSSAFAGDIEPNQTKADSHTLRSQLRVVTQLVSHDHPHETTQSSWSRSAPGPFPRRYGGRRNATNLGGAGARDPAATLELAQDAAMKNGGEVDDVLIGQWGSLMEDRSGERTGLRADAVEPRASTRVREAHRRCRRSRVGDRVASRVPCSQGRRSRGFHGSAVARARRARGNDLRGARDGNPSTRAQHAVEPVAAAGRLDGRCRLVPTGHLRSQGSRGGLSMAPPGGAPALRNHLSISIRS